MKATDPKVRDRERTSGARVGIYVGVLLVILGIVQIARPLYGAIASTSVFGWLFTCAGIGMLTYAFESRRAGQFIWKLLMGVLYLGVGIVMLFNILSGVLALTLILGITIFTQGVVQVILSLELRPARYWRLGLYCGIFEIILAIFIWSGWPFNADWIVGLWVGISFLISGFWIITLSSLPRSTQP